jgi:hypothetical protein
VPKKCQAVYFRAGKPPGLKGAPYAGPEPQSRAVRVTAPDRGPMKPHFFREKRVGTEFREVALMEPKRVLLGSIHVP